MPAVARHLILADFLRYDERQAVVFPLREAAAHRVNVGVSEILKSLGGQSRTNPAGAVDDNRLILVRQRFVRFEFQKSAGERNGLLQVALFPFVAFADIE